MKEDRKEWPIRTIDEIGLTDDAKTRYERELKVERRIWSSKFDRSSMLQQSWKTASNNWVLLEVYFDILSKYKIWQRWKHSCTAETPDGEEDVEVDGVIEAEKGDKDESEDDDHELSAEVLLKGKDVWIRQMGFTK